MRDTEPRKRAPDYTNAALAMGLLNLIWVLMVLWMWLGFGAVVLAGVALNMLITRLEDRIRNS